MVEAGSWFELTSDGEKQLTLAGVLDGWNADDTPRITPLSTSEVPEQVYLKPPAPIVTGSLTTQSSATIDWEPVDDGSYPVTQWWVGRRHSLDNGTTYTQWAGINGSPFSAATRTATDSTVPTQTSPQVMVQYRVRGENAWGEGTNKVVTLQWQGTPDQQPTAPINFRLTGSTTTSRSFAWDVDTTTPSPAVTKFGIFDDDTLMVDDIGPGLRAATWSGLTPGATYTNVNVRRWNGEWSPRSTPQLTFTQPTDPVVTVELLAGVSSSSNDHGGTEDWAGWRVYNRSSLYAISNRTNPPGGNGIKPLFMAYSESGDNMSGSYATVRQHVIDELNTFYYGNDQGTAGSGTTATRSKRWGIKLYWSNGNENYDKGNLAPKDRAPGSVSAANIAAYVDSMRGLYDGVHYIDPITNARRFPDAYAGSNPTHEMERKGIVQEALHPSARYHDFVMWSMYPPGRQSTESDPTYNWPTFNVADRGVSPDGWLIRCFYRTQQAQLVARDPSSPYYSGNPNFPMMISVGEWGIGDAGFNTFGTPVTTSHPGTEFQRKQYRPYYAVYGMYGAVARLSAQFNLPMPFACWWDAQKVIEGTRPTTPTAGNWDTTAPQNLLGRGQDRDGNWSIGEHPEADPRTWQAIQNWQSYNHLYGGTIRPAAWSHITRTNLDAWKHSGTPVYPPP